MVVVKMHINIILTSALMILLTSCAITTTPIFYPGQPCYNPCYSPYPYTYYPYYSMTCFKLGDPSCYPAYYCRYPVCCHRYVGNFYGRGCKW